MNKISLNKLVGRQVIYRKNGSGIHIFLDCDIVQHPLKNDPYIVGMYKKGMKNKEGDIYRLCWSCADMLASINKVGDKVGVTGLAKCG